MGEPASLSMMTDFVVDEDDDDNGNFCVWRTGDKNPLAPFFSCMLFW